MGNLVATSMVLLLLAAVSTTGAAAARNGTASPSRNATAPPPFGANHTVGEGAGWFFDGKANASAANYSAWAANRTIYLGDYISFKTNAANTVVHTTNATVYELCNGGSGGAAGGCGWKPEAVFLAVMLSTEGANYFFSDAGGGEHCKRGMRFEVIVAHGRGLSPVPPSYYEPLSGAPAVRWLGGVVPMRVTVGAAFAVLLVL